MKRLLSSQWITQIDAMGDPEHVVLQDGSMPRGAAQAAGLLFVKTKPYKEVWPILFRIQTQIQCGLLMPRLSKLLTGSRWWCTDHIGIARTLVLPDEEIGSRIAQSQDELNTSSPGIAHDVEDLYANPTHLLFNNV